MARKRTAQHREEHDNTTERDRDPHAGMPPDDLSEQVRAASDDPADGAAMPDAVEAEREHERGRERHERRGPRDDRPFQPAPIDRERFEEERPPRPEYRDEKAAGLAPYSILARTGDIEEAGLDPHDLAAEYGVDPDAPLAGEEGGAPLNQETEAKHHPGAPWPGPGESLAAAPTASPEPGPEPSFQYNPPQPVGFEDKPEAASGVPVPTGDPQEKRREGRDDRTKRFTTREPEEDKRPRDDVPRDEAGQVSIEHMAELALEGIGKLYQGGEEAQPYRVQKALELASRKVMSFGWWTLRDRFFVAGETPEEPDPEAAAA